MRILANENVNELIVEAPRAAGHDVLWVAEVAPRSDDDAVLALAQASNRVLLTSDKDFGELAFRAGLPASSGIVLLRIPMRDPAAAAALEHRSSTAEATSWERGRPGRWRVAEPDRSGRAARAPRPERARRDYLTGVLVARRLADPEGWAGHLTVVEPDRNRRLPVPARDDG